jgi:transcriptional regulator with XRE-family HTH domain
MFQIGQSLRDARLGRRLELDQVAEQTMIRVRYLAALEEERFDVFPGDAYARLFLGEYAAFLGLDPTPFLDQLPTQLDAEREPLPPTAAPRPPRRRIGNRRVLALALGIAGVATISLLAWQLGGGPSPSSPRCRRARRYPSRRLRRHGAHTRCPARGSRPAHSSSSPPRAARSGYTSASAPNRERRSTRTRSSPGSHSPSAAAHSGSASASPPASTSASTAAQPRSLPPADRRTSSSPTPDTFDQPEPGRRPAAGHSPDLASPRPRTHDDARQPAPSRAKRARLPRPLPRIACSADVVVIYLGTSDLADRYGMTATDIARAAGRLADFVGASRAGVDGAAPLPILVSPPLLGHTDWNEDWAGAPAKSSMLAGRFATVAADLVIELVDLGTVTRYSSLDGIHLDAEGHAATAALVEESLRRIFT